MTPTKVALGEKPFFNERLSIDRTISCGVRHASAFAMTDDSAVGVGFQNKRGSRNFRRRRRGVFCPFTIKDPLYEQDCDGAHYT